MPGIETFSKKKPAQQEPPKPVAPPWAKFIDQMVFDRIGGKPEGYYKHVVVNLWNSNSSFRMNVWTKKDGKDKCLSWFLAFSPGGELIRSDPALPEPKKTES